MALTKQVDYLDLYLMHFPTAFVKGDGNVPRNADGTVNYGTTHYKVHRFDSSFAGLSCLFIFLFTQLKIVWFV